MDEHTITVHGIYVKNSSFEAVPMTLFFIRSLPIPMVDIRVNVQINERENDLNEVVLDLELNAELQKDFLWKLKLEQAGLYALKGLSHERRQQILNGFCPNQLYPHACREVNRMVQQSGFFPVNFAPPDFMAQYSEYLKNMPKQSNQELIDMTTLSLNALRTFK